MTHQDPATQRAVELLAAADAVAAAERPAKKPRIHRLPDPMALAVVFLAITVVALSYIVAIQGQQTAARASRNNSSLQSLANTVRDLSAQVDALERSSATKDQLNAELARQNRELRDLLIKHGINPIPSVGPMPTPAPTPQSTSSRGASPAAPSLPKAPGPTSATTSASASRPSSSKPQPRPPSPSPNPSPSPQPRPCMLVDPLTGRCLL